MGKINRKAITSKKAEVSKSKSDASTIADKGAKVSKRSKESGVISLGVKKTAPMTAGARDQLYKIGLPGKSILRLFSRE